LLSFFWKIRKWNLAKVKETFGIRCSSNILSVSPNERNERVLWFWKKRDVCPVETKGDSLISGDESLTVTLKAQLWIISYGPAFSSISFSVAEWRESQ
jgi:hypothetical protein